MPLKDHSVVITAAGMVTALGHTVDETWKALLSGQQGIRTIQGFDATGFACGAAAQVEALDAATLELHPRFARVMDLHSFMLMKCARDVFRDARIREASIRSEDIGFFVGMGMVDFRIDDILPAALASMNEARKVDIDKFYSGGFREIYPLMALYMSNNISACQAAIELEIRGENAVFAAHSDAGAQAIAEAVRALQQGKAKIVLAGGVSEKISALGLARADLQGILHGKCDRHSASCRPFSAQRAGSVLGEGCGMLGLELHQSARDRGVPHEAAITGFGAACEAEQASPTPTSRAIGQAMKMALESAELSPSDIGVMIAHGDGTAEGDVNEARAVEEVFSNGLDRLVVYSSKGALGHMLAAAPAVDVILALSILRHGIVPPTLHCHPLEKSVQFKMSCDGPANVMANRVLVNCRSEEGQCASLVIESER